jgi:hypothetical protein
MRKFCTVTIVLLFSLFVSAQRSLSGVFQTNFPVYGMFGQTLSLNCDSSVVMNFRGDLMNDNSFGRWSVRDETLTLSFDSTKYPQQRYKGQMNYRIRGDRLYLINLTKEQYEELKAKALQAAKDSGQVIRLPSYRWFKKHTGRAMKNHSGKTGKQYFKRTEVTDCKTTANNHVSAMQAKS